MCQRYVFAKFFSIVITSNYPHVLSCFNQDPGRKNPRGEFFQVDTTNILFICGGAFTGLEKIIINRVDSVSIGFEAHMKNEINDHAAVGKALTKVLPSDLIEYGMIAEFVSRFPCTVTTTGLNLESLIEILTVPKNAVVKQFKKNFAMSNVYMHITDCGLKEVATTALKRGTGARGLRSVLGDVLRDAEYVAPSCPDVHTVYVDAAAVRGDRPPLFFFDPELTVAKYEALTKQGITNITGALPVSIDDFDQYQLDLDESASMSA